MISAKSVVLLWFAVGLVSAGSIGPDLKNLCSFGKVSLKTVADLTALAEQADSDSAGCPPIVIEALRAMKKITDEKRACTIEKAVAITTFVDNYLTEMAYAIPKALNDFALAYGAKVSGICTGQMVDEFVRVTQARVYDSMDENTYEAFVDFKMFLLEQNPIGALLGAIAKTGEVILPVDLLQVLPDENAKFLVPFSQSGSHKRFVSLCQRILQPLYEPTLLPIAHLVRNGFISRPTVKDKRLKRDVRFWTTALFFCESLKLIEVEEENTPELTAFQAQANEAFSSLDVKVLPCADDDDDAEEGMQDTCKGLEAGNEQTGQGEGREGNKSRPPITQSALKAPVKSFRSEAEVGDVIVTSRVKPFDAGKSGAARLSERVSRRSFRVTQALARSSKMRSLIKSSLKLVKLQGGSEAAEFERNKQKFVEMIENPELLECETGGSSCPGGKCGNKSNCVGNKCLVKMDDNRLEHKRGFRRGCFKTFECMGITVMFAGLGILGFIKLITIVILVIWFAANFIPRVCCLGACCLCGQCREGSCMLTLFKTVDNVVMTLLLWPELVVRSETRTL